MNLFLDFDGTLIDSKQRLYRLFNFLVPESTFSFDQYWDLKKNAIGHVEILKNQFKYSDKLINHFQQQWHKLIEHPDWIKYDQPILGVTEKLIELKEKFDLILITARQFNDIALQQVDKFKWTDLFKKVLVTKQKIEKENLILQKFIVSKDDWFIGDTGKDIQSGKFLNIKTAAVLSGFRNKENLEKYYPDIILKSLNEFSSNICIS